MRDRAEAEKHETALKAAAAAKGLPTEHIRVQAGSVDWLNGPKDADAADKSAAGVDREEAAEKSEDEAEMSEPRDNPLPVEIVEVPECIVPAPVLDESTRDVSPEDTIILAAECSVKVPVEIITVGESIPIPIVSQDLLPTASTTAVTKPIIKKDESFSVNIEIVETSKGL